MVEDKKGSRKISGAVNDVWGEEVDERKESVGTKKGESE